MPKIGKLVLSLGLLSTLSLPAWSEIRTVTVDQALALFSKNNLDVLIHKSEIDKSEAELAGARLLPNPTASFNFTDVQFGHGGIYAGDNTQWSVRLEQLIEIGGQRGLRTSLAASNLDAVRLEHREVIRDLLVGFYSLFNDLVLDEWNVRFARETLDSLDKTLAVADQRHAAGFLSAIDHQKLKLSRVETENELARLESQRQNDLELFNVMLGGTERVQPAEPASKPTFEDQDPEALVRTACRNRTDLLALEKQIDAAQGAVKLAKARAIPNLSLGAEYDSLGPQNSPAFGLGLSLDLPLFNRNQEEILVSRYQLDQLRAQLKKARLGVEADVRQAVNNYRTAFKAFGSYEQRKADMDDLLDKSRQAFALGGITVLDLIDTQKSYREFNFKYNQALAQCRLTQELLRVSVGGTT